MVADQLVYSFTLKYQPSRNFNQPIVRTNSAEVPIVRTNSAEVGIECRYMRKHNVSSDALRPTWRPFSSTKSAEGALNFSLRLLADDWLAQRTSNVYSLGDVLNIEASIDGTNHMPLRLFVDSCVATMVPDRNASPRYVFIDNSGCLVDAKVSGSGSRFISPRVQNTKLQLRLDAFRFYSDPRSSCHSIHSVWSSVSVEIINQLTMTLLMWSSVDGSDQVCSCCNTGSCGTGAPYRGRRGNEAAGNMVLDWAGDARVGPLFIQETLPDLDAPSLQLEAEDRTAQVLDWDGDARVGPLFIQQTLPDLDAPSLQLEAEDRTAQGFPVEVLVLAGVVAAVALGCIAALAAVIYRRPGKPTDLQF
ncbi:UNVERIFIED_CONTAM: hypothetical protein FKN15_029231 [Acipenser sinensis]